MILWSFFRRSPIYVVSLQGLCLHLLLCLKTSITKLKYIRLPAISPGKGACEHVWFDYTNIRPKELRSGSLVPHFEGIWDNFEISVSAALLLPITNLRWWYRYSKTEKSLKLCRSYLLNPFERQKCLSIMSPSGNSWAPRKPCRNRNSNDL